MNAFDRRVIASLLACVMAFALSGASWANEPTVEQGMAMFRQGDFIAARDIWLTLGNQGDAQANYLLSLLYAQGKGVDPNPRLAMEFLALAAREGLAVAQFNLGNHYHSGKWLPKSDNQAEHWWLRAAEQDMPQAQHNLGSLYLIGGEIPVNEERARYWYGRAAANGSAASAAMLKELDRQSPAPQAGQAVQQHALRGSNWLMQQPADKYTLQVLASESPDSAQRLFARHRFKRPLAWFQFKRKGRTLYGVIYGVFNTRAQAHAAITELPVSLRKGTPWPRRFGEVQKLVKP